MAKSTLNIGQELHSDSLTYHIESVLGQGSFGITYKAKAFTVIKGKFGEELVETNTPKAIKEFFMKEINERDESGSITLKSADKKSLKSKYHHRCLFCLFFLLQLLFVAWKAFYALVWT